MGDKSSVVFSEIMVILALWVFTSNRGKAAWAVILGNYGLSGISTPAQLKQDVAHQVQDLNPLHAAGVNPSNPGTWLNPNTIFDLANPAFAPIQYAGVQVWDALKTYETSTTLKTGGGKP